MFLQADADLLANWARGKVHPVTKEPLRCERLDLPPGSLICCNTHGAHRVGPTAVRKTSFLNHRFMLNIDHLPRQARDKHRKG